MGYAISWIAIRGQSPGKVQALFDLEPTGDMESVPDSDVVGATLPSGWYLIFDNARTFEFSPELFDARMTAGAEAVVCMVEEHIMLSSAAAYKDGKQIWSTKHDAQEGIEHLEYSGELPVEFASIREKCLEMQRIENADSSAADHIFDIPVALAAAITGFRYDQDIPGTAEDDEPFERLVVLPGSALTQGVNRRAGCFGVIAWLLSVGLMLVRTRS